MTSAFSITVGPFTFEALTDSMKGAWDVIHTTPDGCPYTVGRLTLTANAINMEPSRIPGPRPSQAEMDDFICQWATEARRRREAAAQPSQSARVGEWLDDSIKAFKDAAER